MFFSFFALSVAERGFKIVGDEFQMDGKPFRFIGGDYHYFRQHPNDWEETIKKMANGGLNVVQTYVAWNLHEPERGQYNFEGIADIERFITLCEKYNMYVILRPGPYICAEWDLGGFPYWLLNIDGIRVRSMDKKYLDPVNEWFTVLFEKMKPHMYHNGGGIIMVQVENEYGAFNECSKEYLSYLGKFTKKMLGDETVLFTNDGQSEGQKGFECGTLPSEIYATIDFGTGLDVKKLFDFLRTFNKQGPNVCAEFYTGWLDHWDEAHHKVDTNKVTTSLKEVLDLNGSIILYMYFGGTNFRYFNGGTGGGNSYQPQPTTYDYDAPLSETGDMGNKYYKILDLIKHYRSDIPTYPVANKTRAAYGKVTFTQGATLSSVLPTLGKKTHAKYPVNSEALGGDYGYTLYQSTLTQGGNLFIGNIRHRLSIFIDDKHVATIQRGNEKNVKVTAGKLDILVENQGRVNFGNQFFEKTGLITNVTLDGAIVTEWDMTTFNLNNIKDAKFTSTLPVSTPSFYRGTFNVDEPADTFLNPTGFNKGVAFINGFHIGRYWVGHAPQLTLYVPSHLLVKGENELIIFDSEAVDSVSTMQFDKVHQIDVKP